MKTEIAQQISHEMNDIVRRLDNSIRLVMETSSPEEFKAFRSAVGRVMGALVWDVLNPLYAHNPEVKPAGYDDE
jgi:hypothetical protein